MGEKGNLPVEAASAALSQRAVGVAGNLAGVAATKTVEVTVAGVVEGLRGGDGESEEAQAEQEVEGEGSSEATGDR
ncbi:hypothetical protein BH10ACT1_BH10ACT1_13510 [soil metagenome]